MYEVNGFIFESKEEAEKAKKEATAIKYIKSQTQMDNPDTSCHNACPIQISYPSDSPASTL